MSAPGWGPYGQPRAMARSEAPASGRAGGSRIAVLERQRRQELLTPAAVAMIVLAASGFLPATTPVFVSPMVVSLIGVTVVFALAIALNRAGWVRTAIWFYVIGLVLFYALALFITPTGPDGRLSFTSFTAGNLYYFLADVLPIMASALLLDLPWPIFVNVIVFLLNMTCIWLLPHDHTFNDFVGNLGGPTFGGQFFLSASITLGQGVLLVFSLATARTIRHALVAAGRASDLEEVNRHIGDRQRALDADIRSLQHAHAQIANGQFVHAALTATSEIYPVAVSLNLMIDRLARLSRADYELRQIERGLAVAADIISRAGQGDLSAQPASTGTPVDGLVLALVQVQRQVAGWIGDVGSAVREVSAGHRLARQASDQLTTALRTFEERARQEGALASAEVAEAIFAARRAAEAMDEALRGVDARERRLTAAIGRIRIGTGDATPSQGG